MQRSLKQIYQSIKENKEKKINEFFILFQR